MDGDNGRAAAVVVSESLKWQEVEKEVTGYKALFDEDEGGSVEKRKQNYAKMVNTFYDLVTSFYEFGWGQSFHFAPRHVGESFDASLARHEMYLALRLKLEHGMVAVDLGCGVGGPARCIARFSEANIVGVNNNDYQISRAKRLTQEAGLASQISYLKADFMKLPVEDNTYDAAYSIEATVHAPSKVGVYSEILRVLKPGALYASYEWIMTDKYDPKNAEHVAVKKGIEVGNGLPELQTADELREALLESGFEIVDFKDVACKADEATPWYLPLAGSFSLSGFKHTWLGRYMTNRAVAAMEYVKIAPPGSTEVSNILMATADDLVAGGKLDIFTPAFFFLVRKPCEKSE